MAKHRVLVRVCRTYEYMVNQSGGYLNVGFQIKDLYNKLDASLWMRRIDLLTCFGETTSLLDYVAFGDVLIFNSTYRTNMYDKSLVLFVGSNNYPTILIFACVPLLDDTFEMYRWLLKTFISSINGRNWWEHVMEIAPSLIMKRWTKSARIDIGYAFMLEIGSKEVVETTRYESLSCMDNKVCLYASKSTDGYEFFKNKIMRLEGIVEGLWQKEA
ncbi:PREDICTED: FAR1-RELATED SEQUENCE [Prunus dulcis]|uniref:PREDICTED: FAR1-RELATED SEQUENCE n=1 Tax=Prunus dulcis TaxID=3755 RepID=A0A5E4GAM2_PRUDU|nr:PREDICTED: FAR1-RELATED SEQUENCE [Prunus dulcis]